MATDLAFSLHLNAVGQSRLRSLDHLLLDPRFLKAQFLKVCCDQYMSNKHYSPISSDVMYFVIVAKAEVPT